MKTVLLAAGFGSRLWPLSTSEKPKQFQQLLGKQSLLQYTYELFRKFTPAEELYVLTLKGLERWVYEQLPNAPKTNVLIVPERRNTLPHTLFALNSLAKSPDEPIFFTTVDHFILDQKTFVMSVRSVLKAKASSASNVTLLCNQSDRYDPNAGYLRTDEGLLILRFKEKPNRTDLERLSHEKNTAYAVYKDTAMFVTSPQAFADALNTIPDDVALQARAMLFASKEDLNKQFLAMPFIDIATGFYEKATNLSACLIDSDFIDLGRFESLYQINDKDDSGNVVIGKVLLEEDCTNNFVVNQLEEPLVLIGTHDSVVAQTAHGSLVSPLTQANRIGAIYKGKIHS